MKKQQLSQQSQEDRRDILFLWYPSHTQNALREIKNKSQKKNGFFQLSTVPKLGWILELENSPLFIKWRKKGTVKFSEFSSCQIIFTCTTTGIFCKDYSSTLSVCAVEVKGFQTDLESGYAAITIDQNILFLTGKQLSSCLPSPLGPLRSLSSCAQWAVVGAMKAQEACGKWALAFEVPSYGMGFQLDFTFKKEYMQPYFNSSTRRKSNHKAIEFPKVPEVGMGVGRD